MPRAPALSLQPILLARVRLTGHHIPRANSESTRRSRSGHLHPRNKILQANTGCKQDSFVPYHSNPPIITVKQAKDAHVGVVKTYSSPTAPTVPSIPSDLATELSAYDAVEPTRAEAVSTPSDMQVGAGGAEAFLSFLEQDLPKPEVHH